jgi:hypothetical protein
MNYLKEYEKPYNVRVFSQKTSNNGYQSTKINRILANDYINNKIITPKPNNDKVKFNDKNLYKM